MIEVPIIRGAHLNKDLTVSTVTTVKNKKPVHLWFALLVFLLGLTFNAGLLYYSIESTEERKAIYFDFRVRDALERIENRMAAYQQVLRGVAGLIYAQPRIGRQQFRDYVEAQALADYYPGIEGVGFALVIAPEQLQAHVENIRAEGFPSYSVQPPGERQLYSSIVYLEPFAGRNLRAFGFDMFSEPVRRLAMQRSIDTGKMALSGKVRLQQESGVQEQAGFLIYQAIYEQGQPAGTIQERRAHVYGWAYAPFRMTDFLSGIFGEQGIDLIIDIYDGKEIRPEMRMTFDNVDRKDTQPGLESIQALNMMGHTWTVHLRASSSMLLRVDSRLPIFTAIAGILLSGMLSVLVYLLASARSRAEATARVMTKDLSLERARLRAILDGTRDGTWEWNVQTGETKFNEQWASIIGYRLAELEPTSIETWARLTHPDDLRDSNVLIQRHLNGELDHYECAARMQHKDGHWVWVWDRGKVAVWDDDGSPLLMYGTHQDITREKHQMEHYHHNAYHDILTGLPNRMLLDDRLFQALVLAQRNRSCLALMYMDLDGFKLVNDNHGHEAGDLVLKVVAQRIQKCIRASDTISRVGGDEFVVLLQDISDPEEVMRIAHTLNNEARQPILLPDGGEAHVTLSIGIALYPQHGTTPDQLREHADHAMYQVKRSTKNGAMLYTDSGTTSA